MKIILDYYNPKNVTVTTESGFRYLDTQSVVTKSEEFPIEGDIACLMEGIFKLFHDRNNSLRYCNGSYWKFRDEKIDAEYRAWYNSLPHHVRFRMYYGNGVVD
jgi:hypothetical protein